MPLVVAFAALLLFAGCGSDDATVGAAGEVRVEQNLIEFPPTWIGYPTEEDLIVVNTGRTTLRITLAIEGPFMMQSGTANLLGGANRLPIRFIPKTAGQHTGRVWVRDGENEFEVPLVGTAAFAPTCRPSAPCREIRFDPDTGECIETVAEDGSSCRSGNLCLVDEVCSEGRCIGSPRNCDDGSVCTDDGCDPGRGCVNVDITATLCGKPSNPCRRAVCDPVLGCGERAVPDGTFCGDADCRVAHMCMEGNCGEYDVPDGTPCIDSCGEGTCENKECFREEGDQLAQGWGYAPEAGFELLFTGLEDAIGQLYLVEQNASQAFLVSLTQDGGYRRYRSPIPVAGPIDERAIAMEDGLIWILGSNELAIAAHLTTDGSAPWVVDLQELLDAARGQIGCTPCTLGQASLTLVEQGRLLVALAVQTNTGDPHSTFLAYVHGGSGDVIWDQILDGSIVGAPIADEAGAVYLLVEGGSSHALVSLAMDGKERWRVQAQPGAEPLAVWGGTLHQAPGILRDTASGDRLDSLGYTAANVLSPLRGPAGSFAFHEDAASGGVLARAFDAEGSAGATAEIRPGAGHLSGPLLTARDTALVGTSHLGEENWENLVHEIETDGEVRRVCSLDIEGSVFGAAALRNGRWVVEVDDEQGRRLQTFILPNATRAARGWVQPFGSPGGGGRPQ